MINLYNHLTSSPVRGASWELLREKHSRKLLYKLVELLNRIENEKEQCKNDDDYEQLKRDISDLTKELKEKYHVQVKRIGDRFRTIESD